MLYIGKKNYIRLILLMELSSWKLLKSILLVAMGLCKKLPMHDNKVVYYFFSMGSEFWQCQLLHSQFF